MKIKLDYSISFLLLRLALTDSRFVGLFVTVPSRKSTCKQAFQKWCLTELLRRKSTLAYFLYDNFLITNLYGSISFKLSSQESFTDK